MRILYFSRDYTPHDYRFLTSLAQTEHEVFYLRLERRGHMQEDRALPEKVRVVQWAGGMGAARLSHALRLLASLRRALRKIKPDLIHAGPIQTVGLLAALSGFCPLVSMSWGSDLMQDADKNAWYRWATRFTLRRTDVLFVDCEAVRQKAIGFGYPAERIVTFPWGVDLEQFSPKKDDDALRARAGWQDAFVLLHLRSWEPVYGVDVLARGFVLAAQQRPDLRLFLLGGGSLAGKVRRIFMDGGVLDYVHFAGQVSQAELPKYHRAADLYLSASHSDGSSVSLMEALASGVPALVSNIPGNREWVTPGENGWQFEDGNPEALARGILQAMDQREKLVELGRAARRLAEQRANWPENFKCLLHGYALALGHPVQSYALRTTP